MKTAFKIMGVKIKSVIAIVIATCMLTFLLGCAAKRGVDFGHWALQPERIYAMRVFKSEPFSTFTGNENILVLPPLGKMPEENLVQLKQNIHKEMLNYFSGTIYVVNRDGQLKEYLGKKNLILASGQFDFKEAGRIGELLGATHVLCVLVHDFRPYPPQVLAMSLFLVDTATREVAAEMDATFDASQQEVVIAADRYMQQRLAREYNIQSLDIILRSPAQYSAFVSAQCSRVLAHTMYSKQNNLRKNEDTPTIKEGM